MTNRWQYGVASLKGARQSNQDQVVVECWPQGALAIVCDGLGGHEGGALASQLVAEGCIAFFRAHQHRLSKPIGGEFIGHAVQYAQQYFSAKANQLGIADAKTTLVLAWLSVEQTVIGHLGDSRAYWMGDGEVLFQTRDHSVVQWLVDSGEVHPSEVSCHPDRSRLLKVVDVMNRQSSSLNPSIRILPPLASNQCLLLCSDGLWEAVSSAELMAGLGKKCLHRAAKHLASRAVGLRGAQADNTSVVIVAPRTSRPSIQMPDISGIFDIMRAFFWRRRLN